MRTRLSKSSSNSVASATAGPTAASQLGHKPVLLREAIELLDIQASDVVVDCTLGGAGHAVEIARKLGTDGMLIGFDLDSDAIERARTALSSCSAKVELIEANFRAIQSALVAREITRVDKVLFDLGWSSFQLSAGRGFSFQTDEPLLMTYTQTDSPNLNAGVIVNEWDESSIADILFGWGEERYSRRIAAAIVERREHKQFSTARELAEFIKQSVPSAYAHGRLHPATKTFQALRIAVNDELGAITDGFQGAWNVLSPGGRIAVITFHSIEDRLVKQLCVEKEEKDEGKRIMRKVIKPSTEEVDENPRARSAKLRVIEKI